MKSPGAVKMSLPLVVIAALVLTACDSDGGSASAQASKRQTLILSEGPTSQTPSLDVAPKGKITQGDRIVSSKVLLDESGQHQVGHVYIDCTAAGDKRIAAVCSGVIDLEGGRLSFSEAFDPNADDEHVAAITGGTGAYEGATGSVVAGVDGTKRYEFDLFLPR